MEAMRQSWTDDRLDDLQTTVNGFRAETKAEFAAVRVEMREEFRAVRAELRSEMREESAALRAEMRTGFAEMKAGIDVVHERFDRMQQTMIASSSLMIVALIGLIATQL